MKHNDITDINIKHLESQNLENLFNVYKNEDDVYFYNILKTVQFPNDLNPAYYENYITKTRDTWPGLAYKFYKNVKLWWLLCALNNIKNPVDQIPEAFVIKILKHDVVRTVLSDIRSM